MIKKQRLLTVFFTTMLAFVTVALVGCASETEAASGRIFELRTYITHEGRLEDLNSRFRDHTNGFFVKHGMQLVGYWEPQEEEDTLIYILAFPSLEARERSWEDFRNDEGWKKAYAESTENGPLVKKIISQIMDPTDYSPIR